MVGTDVNGIQPVLGDTSESQHPVCKVVMTGLKLLVGKTRWMVLFRWHSEKEGDTILDMGNEDQEKRKPRRGTVRTQGRDGACW